MKILVTGAAGYIGSVVTEKLIERGHQVLALDSLLHGHRAAVHPEATWVELDLLDRDRLHACLASERVDAVVHLAAEALIDESVRDPGRFFRANITGSLNLLDAMTAAGVKRLVFSSTAAVYGEPKSLPITEDSPQVPVNAYGESKLAFERVLPWYRKAHGLCHVSLRYFSACGATERCGELHVPETHIIPVAFEAALGRRKKFFLFGTDYDTPDGTCVRDYVHVVDIARAHILALENLDRLGARAFNLGNGNGYTNSQVVEMVRKISGRPFDVEPSPRRPGDPSRLIASAGRIREELGWVPEYPDLQSMVETAWAWRVRHPEGYPA